MGGDHSLNLPGLFSSELRNVPHRSSGEVQSHNFLVSGSPRPSPKMDCLSCERKNPRIITADAEAVCNFLVCPASVSKWSDFLGEREKMTNGGSLHCLGQLVDGEAKVPSRSAFSQF